jgi:hypothetical protein
VESARGNARTVTPPSSISLEWARKELPWRELRGEQAGRTLAVFGASLDGDSREDPLDTFPPKPLQFGKFPI